MTYCLAIKVDRGLIFCSDSRTNAGVDNVSKYSKMHTFLWPGNRIFVMLSAGNLATTQAVVKRLNSDASTNVVPSLLSIGSMHDAADHVGTLNTAIQRQQASRGTANTTKINFEATFVFEIQKRWNEGLLLALQNLPLFAWEQPAAQDAVHATGQVLPLNANR